MKQKKGKGDDEWKTLYPVEFKWIDNKFYVRRSDVGNEDWKQIDPGELRGEKFMFVVLMSIMKIGNKLIQGS